VNQIDSETLQQIIAAHGAALALYARQWCTTPDDAVQEALIDLVRADPRPDNIAGWLYTTVRRRAMNLGRGERRRADHHQQAQRERDPWFLPDETTAESGLDHQAFLQRLPGLDREIIVARIWGELSFAQIADLVAQPLSTVHRRYHTALQDLGRMINENEIVTEANQ
jgi:RNA polymerase sigma-70 factor (ECF subfamily)